MTKGTKVTIRPASYPMQVWRGEILCKTARGFSVRYELNGMWLKETFSERELSEG